ncbi:TPA: recombinase RecA, partial [Vibrio parahaemolyticus]|nr:recombinase RecA [Vibrio parahaemolyticus]
MQDIIQHLKSQHLVWQANLTKADDHQFLSSSGFAELDELLGGGFPSHGVVEMESVGSIGELRLLAPYLKASLSRGVTAFIQPPALMNSLFLHNIGLDINQVWVVNPTHHRDALWAA